MNGLSKASEVVDRILQGYKSKEEPVPAAEPEQEPELVAEVSWTDKLFSIGQTMSTMLDQIPQRMKSMPVDSVDEYLDRLFESLSEQLDVIEDLLTDPSLESSITWDEEFKDLVLGDLEKAHAKLRNLLVDIEGLKGLNRFSRKGKKYDLDEAMDYYVQLRYNGTEPGRLSKKIKQSQKRSAEEESERQVTRQQVKSPKKETIKDWKDQLKRIEEFNDWSKGKYFEFMGKAIPYGKLPSSVQTRIRNQFIQGDDILSVSKAPPKPKKKRGPKFTGKKKLLSKKDLIGTVQGPVILVEPWMSERTWSIMEKQGYQPTEVGDYYHIKKMFLLGIRADQMDDPEDDLEFLEILRSTKKDLRVRKALRNRTFKGELKRFGLHMYVMLFPKQGAADVEFDDWGFVK